MVVAVHHIVFNLIQFVGVEAAGTETLEGAYIAAQSNWEPWRVLAAGLLVTVLVASYLLTKITRTAKLSEANRRLQQQFTERKRVEEALRFIVEGTASVTGGDFFRSLARHLAAALQVHFALVAKCTDSPPTKVHTLAFWTGNDFGDNFEYDLDGTPCENVVGGELCYYPEGVQTLFPKDVDLVKIGAEGYLGVPFTDSSGSVIGHLAVLDDKPMGDEDRRETILKIFAARAGAELERIRAEADLERAHQELVQTHAQLLQAQKLESVGQLAAGIAHEINTPTQFVGDNTRFLQNAFGDLQTLLRKHQGLFEATRTGSVMPELVAEVEAAIDEADVEYLMDEIPKAIEQSLEGIERVAKIVRSMKAFSHPGGEEKQPVDLNKAIETTITVARNEWKYVADLVTELDPSLPLVPCLAGDFNQVILNMIMNSAHAIADIVGDGSAGKGTITIRTRQVDAWAEITISDTGSGISEEARSKVFDPFFTTKEVGKGTGQGLAISHSVIVNKHGGTIGLDSEVGKGTTFIIRLPIEPSTDGQMETDCHEAAHSLR